MPLRSEPLPELVEPLAARRDVGALRDDPLRPRPAPDEPLEPEDRLDPDARLAPDEPLEPDERLEPEERLAGEERLEPDDPLERVDFFAGELALRLARVPLDAAAVLPALEPELRDEPLERELRDEPLDALLVSLRAVVAALADPLPLLALPFVAFRPTCLRDLVVLATMSTFPGLTQRYPRLLPDNPAQGPSRQCCRSVGLLGARRCGQTLWYRASAIE
jgi:hypothetical protein